MADQGGAPARLAAAKVLASVLKSKRTLDDTLATEPDYRALDGSDRGFARAMVSAALRQLGRIDAVLMPLVNRPRGRVSVEVAAVLQIGAAQLWVLETAHHAAVSETVAAAKRWPVSAPATGLINAVLRKAAEATDAFHAQPASATWPNWLQADFKRSLGQAAMERLAAVQQDVPLLHLTARGDAAALAARVAGTVIAPGSVALAAGAVEALPGFSEGEWWVQDAAAALAARVLAPQAGETVFDLCAAPGGKTLQLADAGADVIAVDRSKARLKRLRENLARTGLADRVEIVAAELESWSPAAKADAILLDAPCSALGTLRRHPEGAWIKSREDVERFAGVQARLLAAAGQWLKPGGRLVYCVCTPRAEEGRDIVDAACRDGGWQRDPIGEGVALGFAGSETAAGDLLTVPKTVAGAALSDGPDGFQEVFDHDAFFVSRLRRA
ncbi:MAG: transcription antitermination factor NusB [Pseudomonadota bacterium]